MSSPAAIAAVTSTLYNLLDKGVGSDHTIGTCAVTTDPLDTARGARTDNQVNLFLYQLLANGAWRNMDMPRQVHPGETGQPPLALNLYYLITAFGAQDSLYMGHRILGQAMSVLHDHPLLGSKEIQDNAAFSDLYLQVERVRITPQPLSLDDMTKLWTSFQTHYRLSAAYEVAVVLVESNRPARTPVPVLTRGPQDQGASAQADLIPPFPAIDAVDAPDQQPAARLDDVVTVFGHHLDGTGVLARFSHPLLAVPIDLVPLAGATQDTLKVQLPASNPAPAGWPAGIYSILVRLTRAGETVARTTNALPFPLAPRITNIAPNPAALAGGKVTLTVTASPQILPGQRVSLLIGDAEVLADPHPAAAGQLTFVVDGTPAGDYWVRLRVDGVDSLLVDRTKTPPVFDPSQKVTLQ
jgi:hypothetical protein